MIALLLLGGCGDDEESEPPRDVVLHGETETGMSLEVEPQVAPSEDPLLGELDAYREAVGAPPAFYTRVTADNSDGDSADEGRVLVIAPDPDALLEEGGTQLRFTCDALEFEWVPPPGDRELQRTRDELERRLCANGPPETGGIAPGERQTYYLFIEQGIESQGLSQQRFFGPRNVELVPTDDAA